MDFRQLQYIIQVAECGSITKAAAKLYITQPSLSNYISKLERELGVLLFDRSVSPIQPTPAGEEYIKDAKRILYIHEQLEKKLNDLSTVTRTRIRLGIPYERGSLMLPQILPEFYRQFPETEVKVYTAAGHRLREMLDNGALDLFILPILGDENDDRHTLIYREELVLCAGRGIVRKEHLLPGRDDAVDLSKCYSLPFICVEAGHAISDTVDTVFPDLEREHNVVFTAYGVSQALRMAAAGVGVAIVPRMTLDLTRFDESAEIFSLGASPLSWNVCAIYRDDAYLGRAERALIDIAVKQFSHYTKLLEGKELQAKTANASNAFADI